MARELIDDELWKIIRPLLPRHRRTKRLPGAGDSTIRACSPFLSSISGDPRGTGSEFIDDEPEVMTCTARHGIQGIADSAFKTVMIDTLTPNS
jgi:transposase